MNNLDDFGDVSEYPTPVVGTPRLAEFLRSTLQSPDFDPEDDLYQAVLDLGYTEWRKPENEMWSFGNMVRWMEENFGRDAALITMLGKFNQQVDNGGVTQWLDNGYASNAPEGRRGYQGISPQMNLDLLEQMLDLMASSPIGSLPSADVIKDVLENILRTVSGSDQDCSNCHNHRYVRCEDCEGTGYIEDDGGEDTDCLSCSGEGEVPCDDCNSKGRLESDADHGSINYKGFEWSEDTYFKIEEEWTKQIEGWLRRLVRRSKSNSVNRTQAIKATESILSTLDKILESL
jgi:hypothetical protein